MNYENEDDGVDDQYNNEINSYNVDDSIGIDDITYGDEDDNEHVDKEDENQNAEDNEDGNAVEKDLITQILNSKGIEDPNSIKYEDENGEIVEVSFSELPIEDQLNILNNVNNDFELTSDETELINHLREKNMSLDDFIEYQKQLAIEEIKNNQIVTEQVYSVDSLSSDDLYIYDLKQRFPNWSDEELLEDLNHSKENEVAFNRKVETLKEFYKKLEDEAIESERIAQEQEKLKVEKEFKDSVLKAASETKEIGILDLEESDIKSALSIIFDEDKKTGTTKLIDALNDPKTLIKIGWFLSKGEESLEFLNNHYLKQIETLEKSIKKEEKSKSKSKIDNKTTIVKKTKANVDDDFSLHNITY